MKTIQVYALSMSGLTIDLDDTTKKVFFELQRHKAMPFLEIAAVTGVRGSELRRVVDQLANEKLVTVSKPADSNLSASIVSISGKYF